MRRERFFDFLETLGVLMPGIMLAIASFIVSYVVFYLFENRAVAICVSVALVVLISAKLSFQRTENLIKNFGFDKNPKKKDLPVIASYCRESSEILDFSLMIAMRGLIGILAFAIWQIGIFKAIVVTAFVGALPVTLANLLIMDLAELLYIHPESYLRRRMFPEIPKA